MSPRSVAAVAPGRWRRHGALAGAAVLVPLVAFGLCEAQGWPFLAQPLAHWMSDRLDRQVRLVAGGAAAGEHAGPALQVRFLGRLRLQAAQLEIAAPDWSAAPHLLVARQVMLEANYADLWRAYRGGPLHVARLQVGAFDAQLERRSDGRGSWQFGPAAAAPPAHRWAGVPSFGALALSAGTVRFHDEPMGADIDARLTLAAGGSPPPESASSRPESASSQPGSALSPSGPALSSPGSASSPSSLASPPQGSAAAVPVAAPVAAGEAAPDTVFRVIARGSYRKQPLQVDLVASGVVPTRIDERTVVPATLDLAGSIGQARLAFKGRVADAVRLDGIAGHFDLAGPSLAAVGDPVGVTLPNTSAFRAVGEVTGRGGTWTFDVSDATVGRSRLNATLTYVPAGTRAVPLLSGRLGGTRLYLADLGPAIGTAPKPAAALAGAGTAATGTAVAGTAGTGTAGTGTAGTGNAGTGTAGTGPAAARTAGTDTADAGMAAAAPVRRPGDRVLPDRAFDLPSLRKMDADVAVEIRLVDLNTRVLEPLQPLRTHLVLANGILSLNDLHAGIAQGRLTGALRLDGRAALAQWNARLRLDGVRLERWLRLARGAGQPPYVSGTLNGTVTLKGQGRSTAQILGSLDGRVRAELRDGAMSHLLVEAAGLDLAQAFGVVLAGDAALPVTCGVADMVVRRGIVIPRAIAFDTPDSAIWVDGTLSLQAETLDLRAVVSPRDFSPLTFRSPVFVRGSFVHPKVSLDLQAAELKLGASALLAFLNPLAALIPLVDRGDAAAAERVVARCRDVANEGAVRDRSAAVSAHPLVN